MKEGIIYHITTPEQWEKWENSDFYESPTLQEEGFMHCSTEDQIAGVLDRYFQGIEKLLILHIETDTLSAPLKWEMATNEELFPHVFGPLNKSAVLGVEFLMRNTEDF